MGYARYLVQSKVFNKVVIHYLVTGHTKFSSDRMFGWVSFVLKFFDLFLANEVVEAINSERSNSYSALLCTENIVKDWVPYINKHFTTVSGVKSWHLVEVYIKKNNMIETRAKYASHNNESIAIDHIKQTKLAPFQLRNIKPNKLKITVWIDLNNLTKFIPDENRKQQFIEFLTRTKPKDTKKATKTTRTNNPRTNKKNTK